MFLHLLATFIIVANCHGETPEDMRSPQCAQRNIYYAKEGSCDEYTQCRDYIALEMTCPEGLHFNPEVVFPSYPCGYPTEVNCIGRGTPQPAMPTEACAHQYGLYPSPMSSPSDCGHYRQCIAGKAFDMTCPIGLAFDPEHGLCDWPDRIPSCDSYAFLRFTCPELTLLPNGELKQNFRFEDSCNMFYSCRAGIPRLLTCDAGLAFDEEVGKCIDADKMECHQSKL